MEYIRECKITFYLDTNKGTINKVFKMEDYDSKNDFILAIWDEVLSKLPGDIVDAF